MFSKIGRNCSRYFFALTTIGILLFMLFIFALDEKDDTYRAHNVTLQNGDLVFIRGRTWKSRVVRFFDIEDDFSHVGIVLIMDGVPNVIHAEPKYKTVMVESAESFLSPANADGAAVFRLKDGRESADAAGREAWGYFDRGTTFDNQFDITNGDKLYCTELVWLAYKRAGVDLSEGDPDFLFDSVLYGKVLMPNQLKNSKHLTEAEK